MRADRVGQRRRRPSPAGRAPVLRGSRACRRCPSPPPACPGPAPPAARARAARATATGRRARWRARARAARPRAPPSRAGGACTPAAAASNFSAWASAAFAQHDQGQARCAPPPPRARAGARPCSPRACRRRAGTARAAGRTAPPRRPRAPPRRPRCSGSPRRAGCRPRAAPPAMASLTARVAPARRRARALEREVALHVGDRAPRRAGPGAGTWPSTQRVMGADAAARAERAAADARRPEADRPVVAHGDRHPLGARSGQRAQRGQRVLGVDDVRVRRRASARGEGARHGQALAARARSAGATRRPSRSVRARARGHDGDVVAGGAQAEGERPRGPAGAARARRVHLAGQDDPHAAILSSDALELLAVAGPGVALDHARARARAQPARAARASPARRTMAAARRRGIAFARRAALPAPSRTISVERRARDGDAWAGREAMYSKILSGDQKKPERAAGAGARGVVGRDADVAGGHERGHRARRARVPEPPAAVAVARPRARRRPRAGRRGRRAPRSRRAAVLQHVHAVPGAEAAAEQRPPRRPPARPARAAARRAAARARTPRRSRPRSPSPSWRARTRARSPGAGATSAAACAAQRLAIAAQRAARAASASSARLQRARVVDHGRVHLQQRRACRARAAAPIPSPPKL